MNRVCLVGRLARDPQCEYVNTSNGSVARTRFTIAVNRPVGRNNQDNGNNSNADFISCIAWRMQAENLAKYQKKGNQISVEGRLQVDNYTNKDGVQVWSTNVIADNIQFLDKKGDNPAPNNFDDSNITPNDFSSDGASSNDSASVWDAGSNIEIDPDELPFY